ncbi:MAG: spermidine synthase [Lentisphaerae bacterium]|nr:spermidine synthase [Lentisphaerota bacterium]MCP4101308.1 spermidine synthase [Lentisphaerota bacterium]
MDAQTTSGEWLTEAHGGFGIAIEIKEKLVSTVSEYQKIELFETANLGKMLVLDDIIQFTEYDEFCYQEMMAHVPLFAHPNPENVLVIGGGDGGVLREIAKHDCVKRIDICEIDQKVIDICREYVPSLAKGYDDPRVNLYVGDGNVYIQDKQQFYDVIIVDSTDPIGPGESLFNEDFYRGMRGALRESGVITSQSESIFLHQDVIQGLLRIAKKLFTKYSYAGMYVPTYPAGNIGLCAASLGPEVEVPARRPSVEMQRQLRYYTPEVHEAAFKLPRFGMEVIESVRAED